MPPVAPIDIFTTLRLIAGAALGWLFGILILVHCFRFWKIRAERHGKSNAILLGLSLPLLILALIYTLVLVGVIPLAVYPPLAQIVFPILQIAIFFAAMRM